MPVWCARDAPFLRLSWLNAKKAHQKPETDTKPVDIVRDGSIAKMTVVSKYLDQAIVRYEKLGFSKQALSKGIISIAIGAYVAHISYPYLNKLIKASNLAPAEAATTSDDDTSDSDFDSDSDDYESAIEGNNINGTVDKSNRKKGKNNHETTRKYTDMSSCLIYFIIDLIICIAAFSGRRNDTARRWW